MSTATQAKPKCIIFTSDSVRAILAGRKVQTRRVVKLNPDMAVVGYPHQMPNLQWGIYLDRPYAAYYHLGHCPYGRVGDVLYVKEKHRLACWNEECEVVIEYSDGTRSDWMDAGDDGETWIENATRRLPDGYEEDPSLIPWRSPIYMPAWASRLTLEIVSVKVERVNEISEADADAEGAPSYQTSSEFDGPGYTARQTYAAVWDSIHGAGAFERGDWVWAISFKVSPAISREGVPAPTGGAA